MLKRLFVAFCVLLSWACSSTETTTSTTSKGSGPGATTSSSSAGGMTGATTSSSGGTGQGGQGQGGQGGFPAILGQGVWLIGWSGGLDHFSWFRFSFLDQLSGSYDVIDAECGSCTGFYMCPGSGNFTVDPATNRLELPLPPPCAAISTLEFQSFMQPSGLFPNSLLEAQVLEVTTTQPLMAAQFAETHCDTGFTMCADPFL